jgi:hypothetical protein
MSVPISQWASRFGVATRVQELCAKSRRLRYTYAMLGLAALLLSLIFDAAPQKARDQHASVLWIAAIENEHLIPIAALIDGRWWSMKVESDQRHALTTAAVGGLPSEWRAHFFNGAVTTLHVSANDWSIGAYGHPTPLETKPPLPVPARDESAFLQRGIAISGDATITLFQEMNEDATPDFGPVLARPPIEAARAAPRVRSVGWGVEGNGSGTHSSFAHVSSLLRF